MNTAAVKAEPPPRACNWVTVTSAEVLHIITSKVAAPEIRSILFNEEQHSQLIKQQPEKGLCDQSAGRKKPE